MANIVVRWSEVGSASVTFIVLVVLPLVAIRLIPGQTLQLLTAAGLDVQNFATQMALIGIVITAFTLVKAITARTSITYFILDVSLNLVSLAFALFVVGLGNIGSLGYSSFNLREGKVTMEILLDLRVFILLTVGVVALSVLQSVAKFREARSEEALKRMEIKA